jgi:serine-aspartate repeat-containing protein C/D/E
VGGPDDVPVVGDWDGDGTDDPGVYHAAADDEAPRQAKEASPAPAKTVQE